MINQEQDVLESLVNSFSNVDIWTKILSSMPDKNDRLQNRSPHCIVFRGIKNLENTLEQHSTPAKSFSIKLLEYGVEQHILITFVRSAFTDMPHPNNQWLTRGDATIDRVQITDSMLGMSEEDARRFNRDKLMTFFKNIGRLYDLGDINIRISNVLIGKAL